MLGNFKKLLFVFGLSLSFALVGTGATIFSAADAYGKTKKDLVNLNTASEKELEDLKGVGPATAKKIIAGRPYKSVDELSKAGLSAKSIESLKPYVTVAGEAPSTSEKKEKSTGSEKAAAAKTPSTKPAPGELVNINTASEKDLEELKGVGPATAKKIIAGRPYKSVDELSKAGLSAKTIESVKPNVTVGAAASVAPAPKESAKSTAVEKAPAQKAAPATAATTPSAKPAAGALVNINTASKTELESLPGIGPVKAQAIIDGRPYKNAEDIMKVKGIKEGTFAKIKDRITVK